MKKIIIILSCIFSFFCIAILSIFLCYQNNLKAVGGNKTIEFTIETGTPTKNVIDNLYNKKIIKNDLAAYIYVKLNPYNLQAGIYELNTNMTLDEILNKFSNGEVIDNSIKVTFVEGLKLDNFEPSSNGNIIKNGLQLKSYAKTISNNFPYTEEEVIKLLTNEEYIKELIDKYWFLTEDILDSKLYYALEGYLAPDTYNFKEDATLKEIIEKLLDGTDKILKEHKKDIENSDYSIHEIITLASIIEKESGTAEDRAGVAGVFYNRLSRGEKLGSDVTTYYGAKVEMVDRDLRQYEEIESYTPYNTRLIAGLPVGPICSPSKKSLEAALNPEKHDYLFFVADKNGKTYFTKTNAEHESKVAELKKQGLWYEYK